ncbi:MAG: CBS domain-containing protein [Methyloceanibacter sp.]|nr:CBS domain-containing protein [Methyloceanibacter sp.]
MKVRDVMTSPVVSVGPDTPLLEAGELMLRHDISGLPVLDREARLVGLITERDFLRPTGCGPDYKRPRWFQVLAGRAKDEFGRQSNRKVADVMTAGPVTITEEMPLEEVVGLMDHHCIHRLPVMRGAKVVGIVSRADLLRALVQSLRKTSVMSKHDEDLRARMTELERESWLHRTRP